MRRALEGLEGVVVASVELETGRATLAYREGALTASRVIEAVGSTVLLPGLRRWLGRFGTDPEAGINR